MKLLTDWGFSRAGWQQGQRGEYWVVAQALLILGFVILPVYRPVSLNLSPSWLYLSGSLAIAFGLAGIVFLGGGLLNLGQSLTPLPYPREDGQLVQTGVYSLVRHPIYSGVILAALGWAIFQVSLSHLIATGIFFAFFNAKAHREEEWLTQKYPDYPAYQQRVKKLLPWLY